LIVEPNGTNPIVKLLEKFSQYHIEHEEQSFFLSTVKNWLHDANMQLIACNYVNLVPMMGPDWMAKICKYIEPAIEKIPFINRVACGQYIILASRDTQL